MSWALTHLLVNKYGEWRYGKIWKGLPPMELWHDQCKMHRYYEDKSFMA